MPKKQKSAAKVASGARESGSAGLYTVWTALLGSFENCQLVLHNNYCSVEDMPYMSWLIGAEEFVVCFR